ncbi:MAG: DUF1697 domain-containing protein [Chloroflexota bacterium]
MDFVAFFRNVNLGQPRSPTRPQLEAALAQAGALQPRSFQTNGTVVFSAADEPDAQAALDRACQALQGVCGLKEPAFIERLEVLVSLSAAQPFAGYEQAGWDDFSATLMSAATAARLALPLAASRGALEVVQVEHATVLSVVRRLPGHPLSATPFFERLLGAPVTTRGWGTILRLVKKFA